ncbi:MAG: hypothetical protein KGJ13_08720, partial [Patescibacteria group bacterium]|nr:hypothetical protein [Patescibacteria group bacterium]
MKIAIGAGAVVTIGLAGLIWWEYEKIKAAFSTQQGAQALANSSPALASLAISLGFKTPAGWVPDVTGAAGQKASQQAFDAVVNPTSQGFYNASLLEYARDNGFETSLSAQG